MQNTCDSPYIDQAGDESFAKVDLLDQFLAFDISDKEIIIYNDGGQIIAYISGFDAEARHAG